MLSQAFVLSVFLILGAHCDIYRYFQEDPFFAASEWQRPQIEARSTLQEDERDREPLSPDYKDPAQRASEQKPVLQPKPHNKPVNPVIPGGVVDVDADGFAPALKPLFGGLPDSGEFDLSSFGLSSRPGGGLFSFGGFFGPESVQWWKGPNVCIEREESTDDEDGEDEEQKNATEAPPISNLFATTIRLSNCQESANKYECITKINNHGVVKTFTVRYKCCYGFKRKEGFNGCSKQIDLKPLLETLDDLGNKEFKTLIQNAALEDTFTNGNYTIFAPTDEALNQLSESMNQLNNVDAVRRRRALKNPLTTRDLVLTHASAGFVDLSDLYNEDTINSENNSTIRINVYPTQTYERMLTANCARIKKSNNLAKNGIVHIVDGIVHPAKQSVQEIIKEHPRLSSFRKVLENTDLSKNMKPDGHYTIFAPTDEAFDKLDQSQKQKILNGDSCAGSIVKHHITAHTVCSSAIIGNATTHNVEGDILNMERTADDNLIIEGISKIVEADIIATNGVIHLVDTIMIPDSALNIEKVLKDQNVTKFREIVEQAGLTDELNSLVNATVFAPSNEAFESPESTNLLDDIEGDLEKLKELVRYHIVQGQMQSCDMNNNAVLKTNDNGKELRVNLYSTLPLFSNIINRATVNCARLTGFDQKSCGSVIHEVNKVLVPPTKSILEVISEDEKYSTLSKIIEGTEVESILKDSNNSVTLLAPSDETFAALDEDDRKKLLEDKDKANEILKNHILTEVLCCSGVGPQSWGFNSFVQSLSHQPLEVGRRGSRVRINGAVVTSCDNLATNGVVHTINKVLLPQRPNIHNVGGFFLLDI